jgi:hypothetical protein
MVGVAKIEAEFALDQAAGFTIGLKLNFTVQSVASFAFGEPGRRDHTDRDDGQ